MDRVPWSRDREADPPVTDPPLAARQERIDRALRADLGRVLRSRVVVAFLGLEVLAAAVMVGCRGTALLRPIAIVWSGILCLAFVAWWAGRHRLALPVADGVPAPALRSGAAIGGAFGLLVAAAGARPAGSVVFIVAMAGWLLAGWAVGGLIRGIGPRQFLRDPRPFVPLLLLVGGTRLLFAPVETIGLVAGLASGVAQQVAYLVGLFAPLEALRGRTDVAAVASALVFAAVHVPFDIEPNAGDPLAAVANAVVFQASVGIVAVLAFVRHRAVVPIGLAHGMAIS